MIKSGQLSKTSPGRAFQAEVTTGAKSLRQNMESLFLTRDQALSLWSGSTDSKTLDYQRVNPKEYQTVGTPTKEIT